MQTTWKSSFLAGIFKGAKWEIFVSKNGVNVNNVNSGWDEITKSRVNKGIFWSSLSFNINQETKNIHGLPHQLAFELNLAINNVAKFSEAKKLLDTFKKRSAYFRHKNIREIVAKVTDKSNVENLNNLILLRPYLKSVLTDINSINKLVKNDYSEIDLWNKDFIRNEKEKFINFFCSIEKTPLTDEQIESAIIMEDRNLVIAAAGSGKTSTLVAKVGYLIKKGYARSDEILILSFNNKVKEEIQERISSSLGLEKEGFASPVVDTFHGLGYKIRNIHLAKRVAPWTTTTAALNSEIAEIFNSIITNDEKLSEYAAQFISLYQGEPEEEIKSLFEITDKSSINELTKHQFGSISNNFIKLHKTLSKDTVRSFQEMRIANWLTLHGIEFKYEHIFDKWPNTAWPGGYRPDFYYPKIDCWHEHFGINKFGKAPEAWSIGSQKTYEQITNQKINLLKEANCKWFQTTSAQFDECSWIYTLNNSLIANGESPKFIGWDRYEELAKDTPYSEDSIIELLGIAIKHFKSNSLTFEEIEEKILNIKYNDRYKAFFQIFKPVFTEYEKRLISKNEIDFEDMLLDACALLESGTYRHPFKVILVDEFQDMSNVRAHMIKAMINQSDDVILFGVGDDWQSIYRFTGADISVMTKFQDNFGYTKVTYLSDTFRCNQGIADVATQFILKNPSQIPKKVNAISKSRTNAVRVIFHSGNPDSAIYAQLESLNKWAISKNTVIDVCLLGRYNYSEPENFTALAQLFKDRINLFFSTIHSSKGLGFDAVIVLGMTDKPGIDFPSAKKDDPVLSIFMPQGDQLEFAEERRLFYVALTRAKKMVSLITPKFEASSFVRELLKTSLSNQLISESMGTLEISNDQRYEVPQPVNAANQKICPKCRKGRLLPRISKFGPWMVCEHTNKGFCDFKRDGHTDISS
jgi:DNA helicase-4